MEPTTLSDRSKSKSAAVSTTVGMLEMLDSSGQVAGAWRLTQPRCTIGSSNESLVCIDDSVLAAVHALIVFGKNHTLIRAMGGQVRVSGRSVREWLIDEPTAIQCGATRFIVYPSGHLPDVQGVSHRVSAGSVADQASRLRSNASAPSIVSVQPTLLDEATEASEDSRQVVESTTQNSPVDPSLSVVVPPGPPAFVVAKLDPDDVRTALEPLHIALQAASDGIIELTRRANESAAQIVDTPPINNNLTEMTHAIETLEDRVASISSYCENLLVNVSESIEGRMSRFDELLSKLAERPDITVSQDPREHPSQAYEVYEEAPAAYDEPNPNRVEHGPSHENVAYDKTAIENTAFEHAAYENAAYENASYENASYENAAYEGTAVDEALQGEHAIVEADESSYAPVAPSYFSEIADLASPKIADEETFEQPQSYSYETQDRYASERSEPSYDTDGVVEPTKFDFDDHVSPYAEAAVPSESSKPELPSWFTEEEPESVSDNEPTTEVDTSGSAWSTAQLNPIYAEDSNRWLAETEAVSLGQELELRELELRPSDLDSLSPLVPFEATVHADETVRAEEIASEETAYGSATENGFEEAGAAFDTATEEDEQEPAVLYEEVEEEIVESVDESEDTEESIEDYMARLLQRVKGGASGDAPAPPSKAPSIAMKSHETIAVKSPSTEQATAGYTQISSPEARGVRSEEAIQAEFSPRQAAPEKSVDLAALRNLANDTARQALHNSSRKRRELVLIGKVAIALLGLGGGVLLLVLNGFRANVAMIGMIASFVVCLLWGYEAIVQYKTLQASKAKEARDNENS